jgi:O-antigen/teichoic acid export membrane protein
MLNSFKLKLSLFLFKGHKRTILAKKNIATSFLIKGGSILVGLLLIPITINYVNPTQYGIWLTLSSIISWFSFFDIGIGNGLKNKLAETNALDQNEEGQVYVSTTYAILTIISLIVLLLFLCVNPHINWGSILKTTNYTGQSLNHVALAVVGFFCASFVIQLINVILTANHRSSTSSLIGLIGSFFSLILVFVLTKYAEASLIKLVLVLAGIPLLIQLISTIWLFKTSLSSLAPKYKLIDFKYAKDLLRIGGVFFIIQIGALVLFQTDNIVIVQLFGPKEVTVFNIAYKLFSVIIMVFTIIMTPFWSAYTDAFAKKDFIWINETFSKIKKYWFFMSIFSALLFFASPLIFKIWLKESVLISNNLSLAMSIYVMGYCWMMLHCFLLNGIGKIRLQLYLYIGSTILNIPIAIILGKEFGIVGVIFSNVLCFLVMGAALSIQCKKILNNTAIGIWNK